jgi:hypothetical protein
MIRCSAPNLHSHATLGECDAWRCECGNEPHLDGFLTRDPDEPDLGAGLVSFGEFLCGTCGRVYDADGRELRQEAL